MERIKPTMHPDYKIGTLVRLKDGAGLGELGGRRGQIIGRASSYILDHYIVLLEVPIEREGEVHRGVSIQGTLLDQV